MALPKEEEKQIQNTIYKIKQLPASKGWLYLLKLSRLVFSGANSLSEILQRPEIQELFGNLSSNNFEITEELLAKLSPSIAEKLQSLKNQAYLSMDLFQNALLTMQAAIPKDEGNANISISSHILKFVSSLMLDLDAEALSIYIEEMINSSVQRYSYHRSGEGMWVNWKHESEGIYAFDNHFAGRYNEMLELFVYLLIFNYAESFLMIKKNQIMNDLRPILDKLIPKLSPLTDE
jgi:hypothetical protein